MITSLPIAPLANINPLCSRPPLSFNHPSTPQSFLYPLHPLIHLLYSALVTSHLSRLSHSPSCLCHSLSRPNQPSLHFTLSLSTTRPIPQSITHLPLSPSLPHSRYSNPQPDIKCHPRSHHHIPSPTHYQNFSSIPSNPPFNPIPPLIPSYPIVSHPSS